MPYLVDGHNLIPKIPGLSLTDINDEEHLIELLQEFCRIQRKQVEVFFDSAPPGGVRIRTLGLLKVHFVRQGTTADQAISRRLAALGRAARNWTVVSSDRAVQANARSAQARTVDSETFSELLRQSVDRSRPTASPDPDAGLSAGEIDEWLDLFGSEGH